MIPQQLDDYLSVEDIAREALVSAHTVYSWRQKEKLPPADCKVANRSYWKRSRISHLLPPADFTRKAV